MPAPSENPADEENEHLPVARLCESRPQDLQVDEECVKNVGVGGHVFSADD